MIALIEKNGVVERTTFYNIPLAINYMHKVEKLHDCIPLGIYDSATDIAYIPHTLITELPSSEIFFKAAKRHFNELGFPVKTVVYYPE